MNNTPTEQKPVTPEELAAFVAELNAKIKAEFTRLYPTLAVQADYVPTISANIDDANKPATAWGQPRKYVRIIKSDRSSRSAYCFIEIATGNILKTASWQTPAKHARGNIRSPWWGTALNVYGATYLR